MVEIGDIERPAATVPAGTVLTDKFLFLFLVAAATIFPLLFVPLAAPARGSGASMEDIFRLLLLASTMHVGLTAYFYFDREYRAHALKHSSYYILLPAAVIIASGLLTWRFTENGTTYLLLFYHAWLLFHYGRQNYGVLAFTSIATQSGRPLLCERLSLHLAPLGGIIGAHAVFAPFAKSVFAPYVDVSFHLGIALTVSAVALALFAAVQHMIQGAPFWRPFFIVLLSLFYVPTFFFDNYFQSVMGYAIAHALQYFVFMFFLAAGTSNKTPARSIIAPIIGMLMVWGLILLMRERAIWGPLQPFIVGAATGLIMWHFVLDAGFWKLSKPWQRSRVQERYAFLFDRT
jgi:hypothetical protein